MVQELGHVLLHSDCHELLTVPLRVRLCFPVAVHHAIHVIILMLEHNSWQAYRKGSRNM
jgi:putative effector of murein hydrolase